MPDPTDLARLGADAPEEILTLLNRCPDVEILRYRDGEALIQEGHEDICLYLVLEGSLVISRGGDRLATQECTPGSLGIVGEMAYFGARMRTATVHSVGASLVLRLQPEHLDLIMSELPMLTRLLCRQFTWRLQESNEVIQAFQKRFDLAPERRMAAEGEILFRAGEAPRGLIQVLMGSVRVDREDGSHLLGPQDLPDGFLEPEAYLRSRPHRLTATVAGSAFLLVVAPDRKEAVVRGFPGLTLKILEGRA